MGGLLVVATTLLVSGFSISAGAAGNSCTVSFRGSLVTLDMSAMGDWSLASSSCSLTNQSGGITTGTFTGTFTSAVVNGPVSATWSVVGGTQKVMASSPDFMLLISVAQMPAQGLTFQGMLSATGSQPLLVVGTVGQINIG